MNRWMPEAGVETSGAQTERGGFLKGVAGDLIDAVSEMNAGNAVKFADASGTSMKAVEGGKARLEDFGEKAKRAEVFNGLVLGMATDSGRNLVGGKKYAGEKAEVVVLNVKDEAWMSEDWTGKVDGSWKATGLKSGPVFDVGSYVKGNRCFPMTTAGCSLKSLVTGEDSQFEKLCDGCR